MESRLSGVIDELRRLQRPGDTDIRVSEGAAGASPLFYLFAQKLCAKNLRRVMF